MKKKIYITLSSLLIFSFIVLFVYWQSLLSNLIRSSLKSQYGLELNHKDVGFSLLSGDVAYKNPSLKDSSGLLASAHKLGIGIRMDRAIKGSIEITEISADQPSIEFKHLKDGSLPIAQAAQRVIASSTQKQEPDTTQQPEKEKSPSFPAIHLKNALFNYHSTDMEDQKRFVIHFDQFHLNPEKNNIHIKDSKAYQSERPDPPFLSIDTLDAAIPFGKQKTEIRIDASQIEMTGRELSKDLYDFNEPIERWYQSIKEIVQVVSSPQEAKSEGQSALSEIRLDNVTAHILPIGGMKNATGELHLEVDSIRYSKQERIISLTNLLINESGKQALSLNHLAFVLDQNANFNFERVEVDGINLHIRDTHEDILNISRAIKRVQSVVRSFISPNAQTALAEDRLKSEHFKRLDISDLAFYSHHSNEEANQLKLAKFSYDNENKSLAVNDFLLSPTEAEQKPYISFPSLSMTGFSPQAIQTINTIRVDGLHVWHRLPAGDKNGITVLNQWIAYYQRIQSELGTKLKQPPTMKKSILIEQISLSEGSFHLRDARLNEPVEHVWSPISLKWANLAVGAEVPPLSPINVNAKTISPCSGSLRFVGKAAPSTHPNQLDGILIIQLDELTKYKPYYENAIPIGIEKSGFGLNGNLKLTNNILSFYFNLTLSNTVFNESNGKLPANIDRKAVISALNGLKNREGDIVFNNNRLEGNIKNPSFNFGTNIAEILERNLFNNLTNLPNFVFGTVKNVGGAVKDVGSAVGNTFLKMLGDQPK